MKRFEVLAICVALVVAHLFVSRARAAEAPDLVSAAGAIAGKGTEQTIRGAQGWLFLRSEVRHVSVGPFWGDAAAKVSRARNPESADPMDAIVDYDKQCRVLGIELILLPVPPKSVIYPDALAGLPAKRLDINHQAFYAALRAKGVNVLDMTDRFFEKRDAGEPLYCKQDSHWSAPAMALTAEAVAKSLRGREWMKSLKPGDFAAKALRIDMKGDLADTATPTEPVMLRQVINNKGETVPPDAASPVVLMGDSHCLVFHAGGDMHAVGAGFADQLALELKSPVDVIGIRGSGARPARIALARRARDAGWIAGKRVIIWCFAAREFTEADAWGRVPVKP